MIRRHTSSIRVVGLLAVLLVLPTVGRCQDSSTKTLPTVAQYRCQRPLTTEPTDQPSLASLRIDAAIWEQTREGLPDLLLSDEAGQPVAFLVRPVQQTEQVRSVRRWMAENPELRPRADGSMEIAVNLKDGDPQPEGLALFTPLTNFELRLRVYAGTDTTGQLLVEDAVLYDYSQFMNVRRTDVKFNSGSSRSFCIVIDQEVPATESTLKELTRTFAGGSETQRTESVVQQRRPIRIDGLEYFTESAVLEQAVQALDSWAVAGPEIQFNAETRDTFVSFTAGRRPLSQITLQTSSRNFSRTAHLEYLVPGKPDRWQTHHSGELRQIQIGRVQETQLTLVFPVERREQWRLRIENNGTASLQGLGLQLTGPASELVWLAEPDRRTLLLYGDDRATAARNDVVILEEALAKGEKPRAATAGPVAFRTVVAPAEPINSRDIINQPSLLIGLAILLTAAMGWGLYSAALRLKDLPDDPSRTP
ncbi:MAG: hypothetical protein ACKO2L_06200 [Planctomycetaceae bacterium]